MCSREGGVIYLLIIGALVSVGVVVPMLMITYPGGECILFTSVRGEALIYGHLAGCNYVTGAHLLVVLSSIFFLIMFLHSRRNQRPADGSVSNRSLRGSLGTFSQSSVGRAKVSVSMVVVSVLLTSFVLLTAIIIIAGYFKTCGELQYEANREIQRKTTLGLKNPYFECFSLFGDADIHNRFHFDHYELNGYWHGQYATYKHGSPQIWSGNHDHQIPIAAGIVLSIICAFISFGIWFTISILLLILRKSLKARNRRDVAESIEDARIWASDMQAVQAEANNRHQYEMINKSKSPYESLHHLQSNGHQAGGVQSVQNGQPAQNGQTLDQYGLLQHQEIIARTHADGSFFQTPEGNYVQLVNGVLTNVDITPMMQGPVQYMELEFQQQQQQQQLNQELNYRLTDLQRQQLLQQQLSSPQQQQQQRQQLNPAKQQSLQQQQQLHQQQLLQQQLASQQQQQQTQQQLQNGVQPISANQLMTGRNQLTQPLIQHGASPTGSLQSSQFSQAPTVSHISGSKQSSNQGTLDSNTRTEMRLQHELAKQAGIRCSQF